MNRIKKYLAFVPTPIWIVGSILLAIIIVWKMDDIGSWWEHRKQAKFDQTDAKYVKQIDDLHKQLEDALAQKREAEAREQVKAQEADTLRQLIDARGGKIEEEQKKIDAAREKYNEDSELIKAAARGDISKFELCQYQCTDSAKQGYPCRPNYCDKWKQPAN